MFDGSAQVLTPPKIIRRLAPELRRPEGQAMKFDVTITGNPEPEVFWYKDNLLLKNTPDTRLTSENGVHALVIPEIFPEDNGLYKVVAKNFLGVDESICRLIVQGFSFVFFFNLHDSILYIVNLIDILFLFIVNLRR